MCGWGTLVFAASGDRYDGEWEGGREHGNGVYTWVGGVLGAVQVEST
jgi:hypothetical protein